MAHAVTGAAGAVSFGGSTLNGKLQEWTLEFTSENKPDRGAGETYQSRVHLAIDWKVTFKALALDQADWAIAGSLIETTLAGTEAAVALKRKAADSNPYFSGTGLVTSVKRTHPFDDNSSIECVVECSQGSAPTLDATPAT